MTMKATDNVEGADVVDTDMQFLYSDGEFWHFMNRNRSSRCRPTRPAWAMPRSG
jgi:translation elongation factor P/translation initiation factor 5A